MMEAQVNPALEALIEKINRIRMEAGRDVETRMMLRKARRVLAHSLEAGTKPILELSLAR